MKKMWIVALVALALIASGLTVTVVQAQTLPNISIGKAEVVQRDGQCFVSFGFAIQNPDLITETVVVHVYQDGTFDHWSSLGRFQESPAEFLLVLGCPEISLEVKLDPDNLIVEVNESDNQTFLDLVPKPTATPTATTSPTVVSTLTAVPTETEVPVVCLSLWTVSNEEVLVSWDCNKSANLYLDGEFVRSVASGVGVNKSEFAESMEIAIDPDGQNLKVFLTWEQLFGAPTATPTVTHQPTTTPEPIQTVVPTTTPTSTPTPVDSFPKVVITGTSISVENITQPWAMHLYWWESGSDFPIFDWAEQPSSFDVPIENGVVEVLILNRDDVVSKVEHLVRGKQILFLREMLPIIEVR